MPARVRVLDVAEELAAGGREGGLKVEAPEMHLCAQLEELPLRRQIWVRSPDLVALGEYRDEETEVACRRHTSEVGVGSPQTLPLGGIGVVVEGEVGLLHQPCEPRPVGHRPAGSRSASW